jgi:hypothetical protein
MNDIVIQFDHIKLCLTLRMIGTEPHAPRARRGAPLATSLAAHLRRPGPEQMAAVLRQLGLPLQTGTEAGNRAACSGSSAGHRRGPNRDRGPRAGHAGAVRRCTKRHRRSWAEPGSLAVHGPRELSVDTCTSRHRRPRDHRVGTARPWAQPGPSAVYGPRELRVDACASRHRRPRDHSWDRCVSEPYAGRRSCSTRSRKYASSYACLGTAGRETILGIAGRSLPGGAA